ncbi:hypothetical protein [Nocardia sp. NPDC058666]|uniref:hypothetical protein n=1 Tax=Nocardia sp. NPDC058666 TaxID=3346587 RepID=UPI00366100A9
MPDMGSNDDETDLDAAAWSSEQTPPQIEFIEFLARVEPEFGQIVSEHERDYGEILPTLVMGDIARRTAAIANAGGSESNPRLSKVLDAADRDGCLRYPASQPELHERLLPHAATRNLSGIPHPVRFLIG